MSGKPFPYRKITKADALEDYQKLKDVQPDINSLSIVGNTACDYLFQRYRVKTTHNNRKSKLEAWTTERETVLRVAQDLVNKTKSRKDFTVKDSDIRGALDMRYGSVNQFRPMVAKYVYTKFKPTRILDFSAGWGNRLLAAMSCNIDYIGIDSNTNLKTPYARMVKLYPSTSKVKMIFGPSEKVDYSSLPAYDLVFTSPPYYMIEKYEHMVKYESNEDFVNTFFKPVVMNAFKYLKKGGYMALNMPKEMKDDMMKFGITSRVNEIRMPIQNRHVGTPPRHEIIYWFKKTE